MSRQEQRAVIGIQQIMRQSIALTDENNVVTGYFNFKPKRERGHKRFMLLYQDAIDWIAQANLPKDQYRVLLALFGVLDYENFIRVRQQDIADKLSIPQGNVARALKGLLERDIIAKGPKAGHANTYRLNPLVGHKGRNEGKTVIEYDDLRAARKRKEMGKNGDGI